MDVCYTQKNELCKQNYYYCVRSMQQQHPIYQIFSQLFENYPHPYKLQNTYKCGTLCMCFFMEYKMPLLKVLLHLTLSLH